MVSKTFATQYFFTDHSNHKIVNKTTCRRKFFSIKSLKSKKSKLALTSFYYVSQEIWLGNSKKLICINQSRFFFFHTCEFKNV